MKDLINVEINENQEQVVSGRELYEFLEVKEKYTDWFKRMSDYGFEENVDFSVFPKFVKDDTAFGGQRKIIDHVLKIDMAKELSMIQRTDRGKQARQCFIAIEKQWNSPEAVYARALKMADKKLLDYKKEVETLRQEVNHKTEVIKGITDDIDLYTKRNVLNRVVRHRGASFQERWKELYKAFTEAYGINLKARCEGYNLKQFKKKDKLSVVKYAEKFGYLDDLYAVAVKLYETEINEILDKIRKIAS